MQKQHTTKAYFLLLDDKFDEGFLSNAYTLLDQKTVEKCKRKRYIKDRLCTACAHLMVRQCVCEHYKIDRNMLELCYNEYGKPLFCNFPDIHFSISHTDAAVFVAVSDENIAVDIEKTKKAKPAVKKRYFTATEQEYCAKSDQKFFEIWTKKEACVKYTGKGLVQGLDTLCTISDKATILSSFVKDGYVMSVCSDKAKQVSVEQLFFEDIKL